MFDSQIWGTAWVDDIGREPVIPPKTVNSFVDMRLGVSFERASTHPDVN